ncbi:MAG: nucleotidyltransferase domain-containing protein [Alcanivorax sp.]|nr:nucleotidyltransferase domain-containing protein [Alcanivorax sp.]
MRLTAEQTKVIKETVAGIFGDDAEVSLFGSRLNDRIGGGDIDLLISLPHVCPDRLVKELRLTARLQLRLGDQPFDVLVVDPEVTLNPVHAHAIETARAL